VTAHLFDTHPIGVRRLAGSAMSTVLVVDDRPDGRTLLSTVLRQMGYEPVEAESGQAALEVVARSESVDLVITDIVMPTMDGYDLVRELRAHPKTADIPVIFCTATYAEEEVRRLAAACGVDVILLKPFEPSDIVEAVEAVRAAPTRSSPPVATEEFYREHLRVLNAKLIEKVDQLAAAERRTAESLTLLETLQSTAPVGLGFVDREFRIRQMNEALASVNGLPVEQQLGRTVQEVVPDLWDQIEPVYRHVLDTGRPVLNQEQHAGGPGSPGDSRSWLANYYPVRLEGEIIGIGLVVLDITERKLAEDFRSVVMDTMAEGLCVADADGRTTMLNAAASRMLGWTEDELRGRLMHDAIHHQHADGSPYPREDCELLTALTERRAIRTTDDAFTRKDGSILPVACSAAPLLSGDNVRGMVVVFRDTTEEQAEHARVRRELDALSWLGRIRDALDEGRMVLYSQPIVPLGDGAPAEELLIRMIGPTGNVIPPGSFLPVAERYGLITEIDNWVVGQAATLAAKGRRVEVNLSAESVAGPSMLNLIREKVHDSGARPQDLVFEITETALMRDLGAGEDFVRGVAELGCGLALDDFGTGFGSFTYLKKLSVDYLKIDIEFIRDLVANEANRHVVTAIVSLARAFGQQTIAEGVEDAETVEVLREYGVDYAQGYHFGRPTAID
jgi:PAS domain S-box-containing protein